MINALSYGLASSYLVFTAMRNECIFTALLLCASAPAQALSFSFGSADFSIGFNVPSYPELVPIPGYPAYYAPNLDANYFFTTACIGFFATIIGMPAPGMTARGDG